MPKEEWGVKRLCPESGKRFYDLNKDPRLVKAKIISSQIFMKGYEDETHRELLRHDSKKLQKVLATIINQ